MPNIKFMLSFRDFEDTIRSFSGDNEYPVEKWLSDFEDNSTLFGWTEIQKLLFAKKSLFGLANLFVQSERDLTSWRKFKSHLLSEFSKKIISAELHQKLYSRKMKRDESVQEYFLAMKELASRRRIETAALMQYVSDGVTDNPNQKAFLYEAHDLGN